MARGLRTRESILSAYESLIASADAPPTGAELAARADVSARSVFTHFGDMDGVLAAAARRSFEWVVATHPGISPDLPLSERLDRFVLRQTEVLERTAPIYRMLRTSRQGARRGNSPAINEVLGGIDRIRRRYIEFVFRWDLDGRSDEDREDLVEALLAASSWSTWEALRLAQFQDARRARRILARLVGSLLK